MDKQDGLKMGFNVLSRVIVVGLICFCASCSNENGAPECDDKITLSGVKEALYQSIAKGGDPSLFKNSLEIDRIKTVKKDKEEQECAARLFILRKYQIPFYYNIAVDDTGEYYVTLFGINDGTKDNVYKVINNMRPKLIGD